MEGLDQFISLMPQLAGFCILAWVLIKQLDKMQTTEAERKEWERQQRQAEQEDNRKYMSDLVLEMKRLAAYFAASQPPEVVQKVNQLYGETGTDD